MKMPKNNVLVLKFKHKDIWYQIARSNDKYILYRVDVNVSDWTSKGNEYTQLGTGANPVKLQEKVTGGKVK